MYSKNTIYYIINDGVSEKVTLDPRSAKTLFEEPNTGPEKILVRCEVIRKKVMVASENEVQ